MAQYKTKCDALPGGLMCGYHLEKTNMDLTTVGDVDVVSGKPGCCEPMREVAILSSKCESGGENHTFEFNVRPSMADAITEQIHNASTEAHTHQRALRVVAAATETTKKR
jgi:hypothetical protein